MKILKVKDFPKGKSFFWVYIDKLWHRIYQMLSFLPQYIQNALNKVNIQYLYELRLRRDKPIMVNFNGKYQYLTSFGIGERREKALRCSANDIEDIVYRAGNFSVYSVEEQIKQGFLTTKDGIRLGLAGEYVFDHEKPLTIRNFTSICVRIPHEIYGCASDIYDICMSNKIKSILIASPPGFGKTTILRDLGRIIAEKTRKNILICDERGEISVGTLGDTCDVIRYANKTTAFEAGVRAMRPDVIITDELSDKDVLALKKVVEAGVQVVASAHYLDISLIKMTFMDIFEEIVVLDNQKIGKIKGIYNQKGELVL